MSVTPASSLAVRPPAADRKQEVEPHSLPACGSDLEHEVKRFYWFSFLLQKLFCVSSSFTSCNVTPLAVS